MIISKPCVVTLTWALSDAQNQPIDELADPTEFFFGGEDLLPRVEEALEGQEAGHEAHLHLEPEHAFGDYDPELVCFEQRSLFPEDIEAGMQIEGLPPGAATPDMPVDVVYTITEIYPSHVVLDGNHPLAGMALRMALKVLDVREATGQEIEAGSVGQAPLLEVESAPRPAEPAAPRGDLSSPAEPDLLRSAPRPAEPAAPRGDLSSPAEPDLLRNGPGADESLH
jgi:FKBP-type peptidyl-prolyl cis-trans isomerase SlyD